MSNELTLVTNENINGVDCSIYRKGKEFYMTRQQIGEALEYADPKKAMAELHSRNKERLDKFSRVHKLRTHDSDGREVMRDTYIYSEQGIYEILMKSDQPKATEFRDKVYELLKALRTKTHKVVEASEYDKEKLAMHKRNADANYLKAVRANYELLVSDKFNLSHESKQVCAAAFAELTYGRPVLPLPQLGAKTYSATQIAERLGITANKLGRIANEHNLKIDEYGLWVLDKAKGHDKQISNFVYYEGVINKVKEIMGKEDMFSA